MKVLLTFDVEVWCGDWDRLDQRFAPAFDRYVYGRSSKGDYALPHTLQILNQHGLQGVFFVESLFAARFGLAPLRTIVDMIGSAGHDIQLHVHPEWSDEITPPVLAVTGQKRPCMHQYAPEDQQKLIEIGMELLREAGAPSPTAFRAGSFAAGVDTFEALGRCGIGADFSIDATMTDSVPAMRTVGADLISPRTISGVSCWPMAVFQDGFGRQRHAQVGACSSSELAEAMDSARALGWEAFVILSHNFEMLKPGSAEPDMTVVRRFERLCSDLARASGDLQVATTRDLAPVPDPASHGLKLPRVSTRATVQRLLEQATRRIA